MQWDILFPDEREKGETALRQCQLVMLRMLKILDYLCNKHGVEYFLIGGTLLGAIRHKGFIPWDDDLDIGMTRDNYEKFIQLAVPELPYDIFFQNTETDPTYPHCLSAEARLRDKYSRYIHLKKNESKWHQGLLIDIFVYDRAFLPHNFFISVTNSLISKVLRNNTKRAYLLKKVSKLPFGFVYASNFLSGIKSISWGSNFIRKNEIKPIIKAPFEDMLASIPNGWDACLKRQYGNYKELPPLEKRVSHHKVIADPFNPCNHKEVLHWNERVLVKQE
jgi:lipopolysaccharide cholinephosphotransferase